VRPVSVALGEFLNQFYSALTKDLSFYQYLPLMTLVTLIFVPLAVIFIAFLVLLVFGYEFNLFHLISFRKSKLTKNEANEMKRLEAEQIFNMIRDETKELPLTMTTSSSCLTLQSAATSEPDAPSCSSLLPFEGKSKCPKNSFFAEN
jgi:hypothetical protein